MAERRMFAKTIIDSDAFLDMPVTARLLYYDLGMRADDDGFVNSPKKIMRVIGASDDDMRILLARKFIIAFDNGIVVIKHWRINNYLRNDRYTETQYTDEKSLLTTDERGKYHLRDTNGIPTGIPTVSTGKDRLVKDRLVEDRLVEDRLVEDRLVKGSKDKSIGDAERPARESKTKPPTLEEVEAYCIERGNRIDPEAFIDYYASQKWRKANGQPLSDWKAAIRTWEKRDNEKQRTAKKESAFDILSAIAEGREHDKAGGGIVIDGNAVDIS